MLLGCGGADWATESWTCDSHGICARNEGYPKLSLWDAVLVGLVVSCKVGSGTSVLCICPAHSHGICILLYSTYYL